ncbi:MAG: hypothetical protein ING29_13150 [Azospirillum sp.]|jgi:hypothetical protein|nr:hypothetical protein [Azospirillum sp.]
MTDEPASAKATENTSHLWKKGKSPNPGGRPKDAFGLAKEARKHGPDAIKVLVSLMKSEDQAGKTRVAAAQVLLDRGYGKPIQAHEVTGKDGAPIQFNVVTGVPRAPDDPAE